MGWLARHLARKTRTATAATCGPAPIDVVSYAADSPALYWICEQCGNHLTIRYSTMRWGPWTALTAWCQRCTPTVSMTPLPYVEETSSGLG